MTAWHTLVESMSVCRTQFVIDYILHSVRPNVKHYLVFECRTLGLPEWEGKHQTAIIGSKAGILKIQNRFHKR